VINDKSKSPIDLAAAELRAIAVATPEGEFLGSEDDLLDKLRVARVTVRQAARLLEREGLLKVRRGLNGGYFAARPNVEMVENIVCSYLNTLGLDAHHGGVVATALWVQVVKEAAKADRPAAIALAEQLTAEIECLGPDAGIEVVGRLEREMRSAIFKLIDGGYIEVLFQINAAFARQHISGDNHFADLVGHEIFVRNWKRAKLAELEAIAEGDEMLAMLAAMRSRKLWLNREHHRQDRQAQSAD
jgi:DNA-binding GntR family transcriptional regulator